MVSIIPIKDWYFPNSEFKPAFLRLKIDIVPHPACGGDGD